MFIMEDIHSRHAEPKRYFRGLPRRPRHGFHSIAAIQNRPIRSWSDYPSWEDSPRHMPGVCLTRLYRSERAELWPLFMFQDGTPLSKQRLMRQVRQALESQGFNSSGFTGIVLEWAQPHQRHSQESKIPSFRLWVAGNQLHTSATSVLQSKLLHHCHPGFCSQPLARSQRSDTQPLLLCVEPFFLHSSTPAHSSSCFQTLSRTYL